MKRVILLIAVLGHSAWAQRISTWQSQSAETATDARVSLSPDGPWLPRPLKPDRSLEIHDDATARPQFLYYTIGARLLLHVDRDALKDHTLAHVQVSPTSTRVAKPTAKTPGMLVHAGTPIDRLEPAKDGLVKIRLHYAWAQGSSFEIRGYVPDADIGKVYTVAYPKLDPFKPDVTLPGDYELLDAPRGGTAFVSSKNPERLEAKVLERTSTHVLVRVAQGAVGWIARTAVKPIPKSAADDGEEGGVEGGVAGGVLGNMKETLPPSTALFDGVDGRFLGESTLGFTYKPAEKRGTWQRFDLPTDLGTIAVWAGPPVAPRSEPPVLNAQNISPLEFEKLRTAGAKEIVPDAKTKQEIERSGKSRVIASFKLCIDEQGTVTTVRALKASGFPAYDEKLEHEMRATWKYKPREVDGKPAATCTAVTFVYAAR